MGDIIGVRQAAIEAGVSTVAVIKWCRKLGVGWQADGRWHVDRRRLHEVMHAREVLKLRDPR